MSAYLATGGALLGYLILAWVTARALLNLQGSNFWTLFGSLALIGVAGAAFVLWFRKKMTQPESSEKGGEPAPAPAGKNEIDLLIREAESKLAEARVSAGRKLARLPVILLLGESGTSKTSTMIHSGLEPELLAGQVFHDTDVVPTRAINLWLARSAVFVEAAGKLLSDSARWQNLIRRLQPARLRSITGAGRQAPRAAVVFVDAEKFTQAGAREAMEVTARNLHAALGKISEFLGISFPVYVLFTRMDTFPFFRDYVRNLSNEEAAQVLGVTLPLSFARSTGVWAEEQTRRLTAAFDELFYSLADKRPEFLYREHDAEKLPGVYEFPREFRKLRASLVPFLVDLCRPSQLRVCPFLRGFYFSGVRPVTVSDLAPALVLHRQPEQQTSLAAGATRLFDARPMRSEPAPVAVPLPAAGSRRVPQWVFVSRLFSNVLLEDRAAMGASGSSIKINVWRRALLIAAAAMSFVLSVCFLISYLGNRDLEARVREASQGSPAPEYSAGKAPPIEQLRRLESLRVLLDPQVEGSLGKYERDGAPLHLRWGLYAGSEMYRTARTIYFQGLFYPVLFKSTRAALLAQLQSLPAAPRASDQFGPAYDTLKAYLIVTSHPTKSTKEWLAPRLLERWPEGRQIDSGRKELAQRQFEFYSEELKSENPFSSTNDRATIEHARAYLFKFDDVERVYQEMLAQASKSSPPISFKTDEVYSDYTVPGAFTKGGWNWMQSSIKKGFVTGEEWVLGKAAAASMDLPQFQKSLLGKYQKDYIDEWRKFLKRSHVASYKNLPDAAQKLEKMAGNQSPLLHLFSVVSQNTSVDPDIARMFPTRLVVPPESPNQYIGESNKSYMDALVDLHLSLKQAADSPPTANDPAITQAQNLAKVALAAVLKIARTFPSDVDGHMDDTVKKLMEDPITYVDSARPKPGDALNASGKALCDSLRSVLNKYPFNTSSKEDVTIPELNKLFRPQDGEISKFYNDHLRDVLTPEGSPKPNSTMPMNESFAGFFKRAIAISSTLYPAGATEPRINYSVQLYRVQNVALRLDGEEIIVSDTRKPMTWPGRVSEAGLSIRVGDIDLPCYQERGPWAVFRLFGRANTIKRSGTGYSLEWECRAAPKYGAPIPQRGINIRLDLEGDAARVFDGQFFSGLRCVPPVVKQ